MAVAASSTPNADFLVGKSPMQSSPFLKIDDLHALLKGNYRTTEKEHAYIQWLFPTSEPSKFNKRSHPLTPTEIQQIHASLEDGCVRSRLLTSYSIMLDFFGMELLNENTGLVGRSDKVMERYAHLQRSKHNYKRITRILTSLGELGLEHLKLGFCLLIAKEVAQGHLDIAAKSVSMCTILTLICLFVFTFFFVVVCRDGSSFEDCVCVCVS